MILALTASTSKTRCTGNPPILPHHRLHKCTAPPALQHIPVPHTEAPAAPARTVCLSEHLQTRLLLPPPPQQTIRFASSTNALSRNALTTAATGGNSPPLAICYGTNARSPAQLPSRTAPNAAPNSRARRRGMGTLRTTSARSSAGRRSTANDDRDPSAFLIPSRR